MLTFELRCVYYLKLYEIIVHKHLKLPIEALDYVSFARGDLIMFLCNSLIPVLSRRN